MWSSLCAVPHLPPLTSVSVREPGICTWTFSQLLVTVTHVVGVGRILVLAYVAVTVACDHLVHTLQGM